MRIFADQIYPLKTCVTGSYFYSWPLNFVSSFSCSDIDDGSSPCCCWTNGDSATTLLRLHENLPKSSGWSRRLTGIRDNDSNGVAHMGRILTNHKTITVKNYGSCFKLASQKHVVSTSSGEELCRSDESILKSVVFNSCFGRPWVS